MKIGLDTNVLVSGALAPFGVPGEIVSMVVSGMLQVCYDARVLSEYREVLARPRFGIDPALMDALLERIQTEGHVVACQPLASRLPDPDDECFLEVALAGEAACLVTGNIKHFPASKRQGMRILTPAEFLDMLRKGMK